MREIRDAFEQEFVSLSEAWRDTVGRLSAGPEGAPLPLAAAKIIVRSAARVEQTFGGINASLWDDPFEWTLPETLGSKSKILGYFDEVDAVRASGFQKIGSDEDLSRILPTPFGEIALARLLLITLREAERFAGASDAIIELGADET